MTAQVGETLILDGQSLSMTFCPPLPPDPALLAAVRHEDWQRTDANGAVHCGCTARWTDGDGVEHAEEECSFIFSTACWREYVGTWEIRDGLFYLVDISGRFRLAKPGPLLADWFTGVLRVPRGDILLYVHMGFGSVFEEELHIMIERGKVMGRRVYDNRGKEHDQRRLGWTNLPGAENRFPGDRDFN